MLSVITSSTGSRAESPERRVQIASPNKGPVPVPVPPEQRVMEEAASYPEAALRFMTAIGYEEYVPAVERQKMAECDHYKVEVIVK